MAASHPPQRTHARLGTALTTAKLALFPVLLAQGLHVRRKAIELPEAEGARIGQALPKLPKQSGTDQPLRLLVVGDSSAAGVGVAHQREALAEPLAHGLAEELGRPVHWQLVARTGLTSLEALALLRETPVLGADLLVTALGVNDVVRQIPPSRTCRNLDALHDWAREQAGVRYWLHCGLPPMHRFPLLPVPLRWVLGGQAELLNRELQAHLGDQRDRALRRLPPTKPEKVGGGLIAEDGFHPGPQGYRLWAESITPFIARRWARLERNA
ncbi:MAG: SGNH/GDSL hydrolase family protein [Burkholderiales bacterium]|nr:SGNH/GDSL hydrolase family protein [Burkholderiales bacterium]